MYDHLSFVNHYSFPYSMECMYVQQNIQKSICKLCWNDSMLKGLNFEQRTVLKKKHFDKFNSYSFSYLYMFGYRNQLCKFAIVYFPS